MLKNHLLLALRTLKRHRGYAALNVLSLGIGLTCGLLILLYVTDELSYDDFHVDAAELYRVNWDVDWQGNTGIGPGTPPPLAAAFTDGIPEIEAATRLYPVSRTVVRSEDALFDEPGIVAIDSNFFELFDFELLEGDPATALTGPNRVVLSASTARRYFGDEPAAGRSIRIGEDRMVFGRPYESTFEVTGVVRDVPKNSHIRFDMLTSIASHPVVRQFDWSWVWMQMVTYVRLQDGADLRAVHDRIVDVVRQNGSPFPRVGFNYNDIHAAGGRFDFVLQPLADVYLGSAGIGNRVGPVGNRAYVLVFATVAAFLLAIACINSANLTTIRATTRAREVAVRKVLGSHRGLLIRQFIAESLVFCVLTLPFALVLAGLLLHPFNDLTGKSLTLSLLLSGWMPAVLGAGILLVGIAAGIYPALYLSSLQPIQALRGAFTSDGRSGLLRQGLVVLQFVITIGVIACALIIQRQMDFLQDADVGFRRDGVVVISNVNDRLRGQGEAFRNRIVQHSAILDASLSTGVPPRNGFQDGYTAQGQDDQPLAVTSYQTDEHFLSVMGLTLREGRGFALDHATDTAAVILNEAALAAFGWEQAVGRTLRYPGGNNREYHVIGVLNDFNYSTLRSPVEPFALFHRASGSYDISDSYVVVRLGANELTQGLQFLEQAWKSFVPDMPFDYAFLDESLGEQYRSEQRLGRGFLLFSAIMILVAGLGLYGLAAFAAEQRTREIGVRKVLGASVTRIVGLLTGSFIKHVLIASVVGTLIAYFAMQFWLENFAYRVKIGPDVFLISGLLALVVTLARMGFRAIRAAMADPVQSLRHE